MDAPVPRAREPEALVVPAVAHAAHTAALARRRSRQADELYQNYLALRRVFNSSSIAARSCRRSAPYGTRCAASSSAG
eukprot:3605378-Prymnesium_polylepis.1